MTDRETLELAARAAGIVGEYVTAYGSGHYGYQGNTDGILYELPGGGWYVWNPLEDDGDALRLAVRCHIYFYIGDEGEVVYARYFDQSSNNRQRYAVETRTNNGGDAYATTRRAIVRAVAKVGRSME